MAWVKLDDAMPNHPKVMAAGPAGFALDVAGICYSNKHATDGFIPAYALAAVCPSLPNAKKWARRLVEVGRWVEVDGGWEIHDIGDFQPSAAEQKQLSKKRAEAGRRGGLQSGSSRREARGKQVASTERNPDPTRPDQAAAAEGQERDDGQGQAAAAFETWNLVRALDEARRRKKAGLKVINVEGLARESIAKDAEFRAESQRIWSHRNCSSCGGKASRTVISPGSGGVQVPCEEPV